MASSLASSPPVTVLATEASNLNLNSDSEEEPENNSTKEYFNAPPLYAWLLKARRASVNKLTLYFYDVLRLSPEKMLEKINQYPDEIISK